MIPGPVAVLILSVVAVRVVNGSWAWMPFLVFLGVAMLSWLALHLVLGMVLRRIGHWRLGDDPRLASLDHLLDSGANDLAATQWARIEADLMEDPVYVLSRLALLAIKWSLIAAAGFYVTF